jgi:hypothetical protein
MRWNPVAGAATYNLQVATDNAFAAIVYDNGTLTGNSGTVGPLADTTTYFWRVNATNPSGTSGWSTVWSFTTATPPAAPILVSPVNGATGVSITPTLVWDTSAGATNYVLQVATDSSFVSLIYNDTSGSASTSRVVSSLANSTTYYWRVRARNATGSSAWSTVWSFTTGPNSFVVHYPSGPQKIARKPVTVYNLLGRRVSRGGPVECRAMTSGCYIYKTGDQIKKSASLR